MKNETKNAVVVKLSKHAGAGNLEHLRAYVVNSTGKIIETAHFKGDEAVLTSPRKSLEGQKWRYTLRRFHCGRVPVAARKNEPGIAQNERL